MHELRDGRDEPDDDGRGARCPDADAVRERIEPRSRDDYAAHLERAANLEVLRRFDPRRAGLPEMSSRDAAAYLDSHQAGRPWLVTARDRLPDVQRVFAALDQGGGHAHIRHEGWVTEEMNRRRVAYLEDPAQLDPAKRAAGIDGLVPGNQRHRCGSIATRITDPDVFAATVSGGVEHPDVRSALDTEFRPRRAPGPVTLPIADLLGPYGHRYCAGWQLETIRGSMRTAREQRDEWAAARVRGNAMCGAEPKAGPVDTFAGGTVTFGFGPNRARNGYEIVTMYVNPAEERDTR